MDFYTKPVDDFKRAVEKHRKVVEELSTYVPDCDIAALKLVEEEFDWALLPTIDKLILQIVEYKLKEKE